MGKYVEGLDYVMVAQDRIVPVRAEILGDASRLTSGDREATYGPPIVNLTCAGELKALFRRHLRRDISPGELEALDMVLTKLGRLATGSPTRDTYVDLAAYAAIAGEIFFTVAANPPQEPTP